MKPHQILGVKSDATIQTIKLAYNNHPRKSDSVVQAAYQSLVNPFLSSRNSIRQALQTYHFALEATEPH